MWCLQSSSHSSTVVICRVAGGSVGEGLQIAEVAASALGGPWVLDPGTDCACVSLTFPTPHPQESPLSATRHSCIWALVTSSSSLCPCPSVHSDLAPTSLVHGDRSLPAYQSEWLSRAVQCPPASSWLPSHLPALLPSFSRPRPCSPQPPPDSLPVLLAAALILLAHSQALSFSMACVATSLPA